MRGRFGVAEILDYLEANGWRRQPVEWRGASIWYSGDHEVLVPARDGMGDGELRLRELVDVLTVAEQRPREEIVRDLRDVPADTQWFRIFPVGLPSGFATLRQGIGVLRGVEGAYRAVARAVVEGPHRSFRGDPPDEVERLLSQVQLGPAQPGSYVLPVRLPLGVTADGEPPLGRKVTLGLRSAVAALSGTPDVGDLLAADVSADLCEALGDFGDSRFEIKFRWATGALPAIPEATYDFREDTVAAIRTAAARLRELAEADTVSVTGFIRTLRQETPQEDNWLVEVRGDVALVAGRRSVWVRLPDRDSYEAAIAAHRAERQVRVRGVLSTRGRRTELAAEATGFEVLA